MDRLKLELPRKRYISSRTAREIRERLIELVLLLAATSSIATMIAIIFTLVSESVAFFQEVSILEFLTSTQWTPLFAEAHYGILPLVSGTLVTTAVALAVAIPLGTMAAIYLSEFVTPQIREIIKPCLEMLAGIPTVVYGYFAFLFVTPLLQKILPNLPGFNMLSAGLVMGIMILPFISSISEDAMRAVPVGLREGSYAMGATKWQTAWRVVYPAAISGIFSAYILGISRAVGVTMVAAIAAGLEPKLTWNPTESAATITAYIVQVSLGDLPHGSLEYQTIFAAGLTLVLLTLGFNIAGHFLSKRYREIY
ncbi:MAG: phosphate ABC transporter permease subunit PstC [Desertifilum sp.]|nr:phosphate ABC transporter permease subunit PstC [Oscillatoria laete-virens]MCD8489428.1 phosphate ABC transporter permease subunit PstC [Desertifilum sp.]MDL5054554.1 phosphate ABC transporter permease subunit PstC [Oscillatoria laete-virens NRMC-F 0139]